MKEKQRKLIDVEKGDLKSIRLKAFAKGVSIKKYIEMIINQDQHLLSEQQQPEQNKLLNDFLNKLLVTKNIEIEKPICSNNIAKCVNKYLENRA